MHSSPAVARAKIRGTPRARLPHGLTSLYPERTERRGRCLKNQKEKGFSCLAEALNSWCRGRELNSRHGDFQSPALPTELPRRREGCE